jgi:YHS domain-containing protein
MSVLNQKIFRLFHKYIWYKLITDYRKAFIIDPVCRMIIRDEANAVQHPEMAGLLFCSAHCMEIYRRNYGKQDVN